jgi:hypothetical protein
MCCPLLKTGTNPVRGGFSHWGEGASERFRLKKNHGQVQRCFPIYTVNILQITRGVGCASRAHLEKYADPRAWKKVLSQDADDQRSIKNELIAN